ncbi:hypothetical protein FDZ71_13250, partial [bacterium]
VMFVAALYGVSVFAGYLNGFYPEPPVPTITPWGGLAPQREYYLWLAILNPFFNLLIIVVYAAFVQLAARALGGQGAFEDTFALLSFVTVVQIPLMWIPETILFVSGSREILWFVFGNPLVDSMRQTVTFVWILCVSVVAVKNAHRLSPLSSAAAALVGFAPMTFVALTYIR